MCRVVCGMVLVIIIAKKIGLRVEWLQDHKGGFQHFDLTPRRRVAALNAGAVEKDLKEYLRGVKELKIEPNSR